MNSLFSNFIGIFPIKELLVIFFASSSFFPKKGFMCSPGCWRRWAIILLAYTSGQMVPHHMHFILDLEPLEIFSTLSSSKMLLKGVEINSDLFDACSGITGEESGQCYWNKQNFQLVISNLKLKIKINFCLSNLLLGKLSANALLMGWMIFWSFGYYLVGLSCCIGGCTTTPHFIFCSSWIRHGAPTDKLVQGGTPSAIFSFFQYTCSG